MSKVSYKDRKAIVYKFIDGADIKDLSEQFGVSKRVINSVLDSEQETRTELERVYSNINVARENREIEEVKHQALRYTKLALEEGQTTDNKLKYLDKIAVMLNGLDRIARLNRGESTDRTESSSAVYNVADIMKELKTPEDKKEYLMKKLTNS